MSWNEIASPRRGPGARYYVSVAIWDREDNHRGMRLTIRIGPGVAEKAKFKPGDTVRLLAGDGEDDGQVKLVAAKHGYVLRRGSDKRSVHLCATGFPGLLDSVKPATYADFEVETGVLTVTLPAEVRAVRSPSPATKRADVSPARPIFTPAGFGTLAPPVHHAGKVKGKDLIEQVQPENAGSRRQALGALRFRDDPRAESDRYPIYGSAPPSRRTAP